MTGRSLIIMNSTEKYTKYEVDDFVPTSIEFNELLTQGDIPFIHDWLSKLEDLIDESSHQFPCTAIMKNFIEEANSNFQSETGARLRPPDKLFLGILKVCTIIFLCNILLSAMVPWLALYQI